MFLEITMMILVIAMLFAIYRLIRGPYLWDRLMALNLISIKSLTLLIVYAVYRERYILLDVSLAYAIAGFLVVTLISRFILRGGRVK